MISKINTKLVWHNASLEKPDDGDVLCITDKTGIFWMAGHYVSKDDVYRFHDLSGVSMDKFNPKTDDVPVYWWAKPVLPGHIMRL
jgi:hypothetical protein